MHLRKSDQSEQSLRKPTSRHLGTRLFPFVASVLTADLVFLFRAVR